MTPTTSSSLPLADAALRLRKRPGRKPKPQPAPVVDLEPGNRAPVGQAGAGIPGSTNLENSHASGSSDSLCLPLCPVGSSPRRLLSVEDAASYLAVAVWTMREWARAGVIPVVRITLPAAGRGRPFRKVLIDIQDLDRLIEASKVGGADDVARGRCISPTLEGFEL